MAEFGLAVLASGQGSNLQALIDEVHRPGLATIVLVLSDREHAPALERARKAGITALALPPRAGEDRERYHSRMAAVLAERDPDLVVLAGYMRLLPPAFIATQPPIINVHPSLLPAFPGLAAPDQALARGVKVSGCTVHLVDEGTDTGPIICQNALDVLPGDTPESLHGRIKDLEHRALVRAVRAFAAGRVKMEGGTITMEEDENGR